MILNYRYRLYPNKTAESTLSYVLEACRQLYNTTLEHRIVNYRDRKHYVNYNEQWRQLQSFYREDPLFSGVYSQVLQTTLKRLDNSFRGLFKNGRGFPRYKARNRYHSFVYPQNTGFAIVPTRDKHAKLRLGGIGYINMRYHRPILDEATAKTCTILNKNGKWYAVISIVLPDVPKGRIGKPIGIDVGLEKYAMLSTKERVENPRYYRKSEKKLAHEQRKAKRMQKGSNNRKKQMRKVANVHEHIVNQRRDFLHKLSRDLINNYSYIKVENLQIRNMVRNHKLAKSIADAGWGTFFNMLVYKAEGAGTLVEFVNPNGTSQTCTCDERVPKALKDRIHVCPKCGLVADRDWVSSEIIKGRDGTSRTKQACGELGDLTRELVGVTSSAKQEAPSVREG
jgi:putative transposase